MNITGDIPVMTENPVDVVRVVLAEKVYNIHSGYDVDADDILEYLSMFPDNALIKDRVQHFKLWLELDPDQWVVDDAGHRNGMYYSNNPASLGMLCNPDKTRSIFDDVDD